MKNFIPVIFWAFVILVLSASAKVNVPENWSDIVGIDKAGHFAIYAVLSVLMSHGFFKTHKQKPGLNTSLLIVLVCSFYGVLMELLQFTFFTGRYFEVLDIIANIIGCFAGLLIFKLFIIKKS